MRMRRVEGGEQYTEELKMKTKSELINTIVDRINLSGCRITLPYREPSPLTVLIDGEFSGASYIPVYPSTLYIYGISGQVSVSDLIEVEQISSDKYVLTFGREAQFSDLMIKIIE